MMKLLYQRTKLLDLLGLFKDKDMRYNGIIRLMNMEVFKESYSLIMSNPGKKTPWVRDETQDKINT
jgi:hypothetical protein